MKHDSSIDYQSMTFGIIIAELLNAGIAGTWDTIMTWGIAAVIMWVSLIQRRRFYNDSYYRKL
jgi:hypothetical protein